MSEVCRFLVGMKFVKEKLNLLKNIWWGEIRLISSPQAAINVVSCCLSNIIHLFTNFRRINCSHLQTCINDILAATDCQKCLCEVISDPFLCPTAAPWFLIICQIRNNLRSPVANYDVKILSFQRYSLPTPQFRAVEGTLLCNTVSRPGSLPPMNTPPICPSYEYLPLRRPPWRPDCVGPSWFAAPNLVMEVRASLHIHLHCCADSRQNHSLWCEHHTTNIE